MLFHSDRIFLSIAIGLPPSTQPMTGRKWISLTTGMTIMDTGGWFMVIFMAMPFIREPLALNSPGKGNVFIYFLKEWALTQL
jgi:hypothetical protein